MTYRPKNTQERILHRLKIVRGHIEKVIQMVGDDIYCIDIIHQSQAIQKALHEIDNLILEEHLKGCVADAIKKGEKDEVVKEVMNIFNKSV